jgi:hypothetical protein
MDTVDNSMEYLPQESGVSFWSTALRYGLIGALVLIIFNLVVIVGGINMFSITGGILSFLISMAIYIGLMIMAVRTHRDKELGGFISLGRGFMVAFISSAIAGIVSSIFNFIYNKVDPSYMEGMKEKMTSMYENLGLSEEQIEQALSQMDNPYTPGRILLGIGIGLAIGAVIALIVASIMKRVRPESAA